MTSPAEAAYAASNDRLRRPFSRLPLWEQKHWEGIADAVINQSKTIIAEEMAKALLTRDIELNYMKPPASNEVMNALMWYAKKRHLSELVIDDGKRAAKALRAVITQPTASTPQT